MRFGERLNYVKGDSAIRQFTKVYHNIVCSPNAITTRRHSGFSMLAQDLARVSADGPRGEFLPGAVE